MVKDLEHSKDIAQLVNTFYGQVRADELLGPIFNTVVGDHWDEHLPKMYSFWGMSLFGEGGYRGHTVQKHVELDKTFHLEEAHFNRWISLWEATVNSLYAGPIAEQAKKKATLMMQLIRIKVDAGRTGKSLF